jgi:integrase
MGPIPRTGSATSGQTPTRLLAVMAADVVDYTRLTEAAELETHVRLRALRVGIMIGARAGMPFAVYPHMLRHGCGYALANAGHDTRALATRTSSTRCGIPSCGPTASMGSGRIDPHDHARLGLAQ